MRNPIISLTLPIRTTNPLNGSHGHWSKLAKQRKEHRTLVGLAVRARVSHCDQALLPAKIRLIRLAPSKGFDSDNLAASFKAVRDGAADGLGLSDDNDSRLTWEYAQERSKTYGIRVEVRAG